MDLSNPRLFETVLDSLEAGVYLVDRHRKIVYWNHGAERISGYLRQDVTGRFCRDDISGALRRKRSRAVRQGLSAGRMYERWKSAGGSGVSAASSGASCTRPCPRGSVAG
jgi:PAS domain S-box-containing protein